MIPFLSCYPAETWSDNSILFYKVIADTITQPSLRLRALGVLDG